MITRHLPTEAGIYRIINTNNAKSYIGYSSNIQHRLHTHKTALKRNVSVNKNMQLDWNNNNSGWLVMVEELTNDINRERYWIDFYDSINTGYNISYGTKLHPSVVTGIVERQTGKTFSDSTRNKISEALTGRKLSKEHVQHLSDSHKGQIPWNKGTSKRGVK